MEHVRHTVATLVAAPISDEELAAALGRLYHEGQDKQSAAYIEMRNKLRSMKAEPNTMDCWIGVRESMDEPPERVIDVSGREMGSEQRWAIEYNPWPEWLGMAIHLEPGLELSAADMLANVLYEMSWAGFDQDEIADQKAEIMDRADEVQELIDSGRINELHKVRVEPKDAPNGEASKD